MLEGVYRDMSNEDYHNNALYENEGWLSSTLLKAARDGYQAYESFLDDDFKQTPSMRFGSIVHAAILEADKFEEQWGGKLTSAELAKLGSVLKRFPTNVLEQLEAAESEVSLFVKDSRKKVRFDAINWEGLTIFDVKTTSSLDSFKWSVAKFGYDLQAYHYLSTAEEYYGKSFNFVWVAVETVRPFRVKWYAPSPTTIESGESKYLEAIAALEEFKEGYERTIPNELEYI
jgi:hypothetical protein